ncbi:MAG: transglycosylase SLT domain-containing protein [Bacteroidales bacterium]|nr:transglycosylase SLT domain-containing protein [Bacteroidales bacterium]
MNLDNLAVIMAGVVIAVALFILIGIRTYGDVAHAEPTDEWVESGEPDTEETLCEAPEGPTTPETAEVTTTPTEASEPSESPTEPVEPSEAVTEPVYEPEVGDPIVSYYDVPLSDDLQDHIFSLCEMYNVDPAIVIAMIEKESTYDPKIIGDNGNSFGLMQIQPRWHQERMDILGVTDLLDPYQNVQVGIDYLADMIEQGGSIEWALMAYNGGPSYANDMVAIGSLSYYARTVLSWADALRG